MAAAALTDCGRRRESNQDSVCCIDRPIGNLPNLYMVADGMGGHKAGEYASKFAVDAVAAAVEEDTGVNPVTILNRAIQKANLRLYEKSLSSSEYEGMGTTLVLACVQDHTVFVSNIGDSRMYIAGDRIRQITRDHSLVEELVFQGKMKMGSEDYYEQKNIITRAMGIRKQVTPDFFETEIREGEKILLCSDGLTNMLSDPEILRILSGKGELSVLAERLIRAANERGGKDNISVLLADPAV